MDSNMTFWSSGCADSLIKIISKYFPWRVGSAQPKAPGFLFLFLWKEPKNQSEYRMQLIVALLRTLPRFPTNYFATQKYQEKQKPYYVYYYPTEKGGHHISQPWNKWWKKERMLSGQGLMNWKKIDIYGESDTDVKKPRYGKDHFGHIRTYPGPLILGIRWS